MQHLLAGVFLADNMRLWTEPVVSSLFKYFCLHVSLHHESDVADTASSSFLELLVFRADGFNEGLWDPEQTGVITDGRANPSRSAPSDKSTSTSCLTVGVGLKSPGGQGGLAASSCTTDLDGTLAVHDDAVVGVGGQPVQGHDGALADRCVFRLEVANQVGHGPSVAKGGPVAAVRAAVFNGLGQTATEPVVGLRTETAVTTRPVSPDSRTVADCSQVARR